MSRAVSALHRFFLLNKHACARLKPLLPHAQAHLGDRYLTTVARYLNAAADGAVVLDVGGGKSCGFASARSNDAKVKILAVDISEEELLHNRDVDARLVADVVQALPFRDQEVDMIVSRSVLEHLRGTEDFIENAAKVLKPGGYFIHLFPCRFAPFALLNRSLPQKVSRRVVHFFRQGSDGRLGFPAYYDRCYPDAMRSLLAKGNFEVTELRVSYFQSTYFEFFLPLFLLSVVYELAVYGLGAQNLSAYALVVARKK